jgi:AcrR family transcriptional regulator
VSTSSAGSPILGRVSTAARYHHGNLRQALVDAAVAAARERGPDGLALRELARTVGVSHNAAYRHFSDREALVEAVAHVGLAGLVASCEQELATVRTRDPVLRARRRLSALGRGYVAFAVAEPGLFRVLFTAYPEPPGAEDPQAKEVGPDPYGMLNEALDELVEVGFLAPEARPGAEVNCWAAVHGFSVLATEGPLRGLTAPERDAMVEYICEAIDRGYGATTPGPWGPR